MSVVWGRPLMVGGRFWFPLASVESCSWYTFRLCLLYKMMPAYWIVIIFRDKAGVSTWLVEKMYENPWTKVAPNQSESNRGHSNILDSEKHFDLTSVLCSSSQQIPEVRGLAAVRVHSFLQVDELRGLTAQIPVTVDERSQVQRLGNKPLCQLHTQWRQWWL